MATIYAAANLSKWAWAFVRVPGLIIILVVAFAFAEAGVLQAN